MKYEVSHYLQRSCATGIGKGKTVAVFKVKSILKIGFKRPENWRDKNECQICDWARPIVEGELSGVALTRYSESEILRVP